jgi:hypothetical protein
MRQLEFIAAPPNNGMHPTRDTTAFIYLNQAGGRVMPGVRAAMIDLMRRDGLSLPHVLPQRDEL